ncbi:MAG TPA: hypothetical protein VGN17_06855 [Bryobacteraceae bacterium]
MTRRFAGFFLLLVMASTGAYAVAEPRVSQNVHVEFSVACRQQAELPAIQASPARYPSEQTWHSPASPRVRRGVERALYQRPPPAAI